MFHIEDIYLFTKSKTNVSFAITLKIVHVFLSDLAGAAAINVEQCVLKLSTSPGTCTHTTL